MKIQFVIRQSKPSARTWQSLIRQVLPGTLSAVAARQQAAAIQNMIMIQDIPAEPSICVTFAGPIVMRRINRETRGVDRLTDVLSFPLLDMREGCLARLPGPQDFDRTPDGWILLPLGDIVIAPDVAQQQAAALGHSINREMSFLALHGLLHLLGYDHETPEQEMTMTSIQETVLAAAGLSRRQQASRSE